MSSDISSQLHDYLSKGSKNGSRESLISSGTGLTGINVLSWWKNRNLNGSDDLATNNWYVDAQKDPCLPSLSKRQRVIGFIGCLLMGTFCLSLASLYLPILLLKSRKFAVLYTFGSIFIILSFSLLWGPLNHLKHLFSKERLPFTTVYFSTMFATIYFALSVESITFTVIFAVLQVIALIWYIVSHIPGGQRGLQFFSKIFYTAAAKTAQKTLPI